MLVHGVTRLLTYNARDFSPFSSIEVHEPA
jgi:hypothetical protein